MIPSPSDGPQNRMCGCQNLAFHLNEIQCRNASNDGIFMHFTKFSEFTTDKRNLKCGQMFQPYRKLLLLKIKL